MTVESNYTIAITTLNIWLQNVSTVFLTNEKQNQNRSHLVRAIFPCYEQVTGKSQEFWLVHRAAYSCYD